MRKAVYSLVAVLLLASMLLTFLPGDAVAASSSPTITVGNADAMANFADIAVPITIENNPGVISMRLHVTYDSTALELTRVEDGGILGNKNHPGVSVFPYVLSWVNDTAEEDFTANGTIATLHFSIRPGAAAGSYPITLSYDSAKEEILNEALQTVDFALAPGTVALSGENAQTPVITNLAHSLYLDDLIYINKYVQINASDYDENYIEENGGLLIWDHAVTADEAIFGSTPNNRPGLTRHSEYDNQHSSLYTEPQGPTYCGRTEGIAPTGYSKPTYLRVYLKLYDGQYAYGPLSQYGVATYCNQKISDYENHKGVSDSLKELCEVILAYGNAVAAYRAAR